MATTYYSREASKRAYEESRATTDVESEMKYVDPSGKYQTVTDPISNEPIMETKKMNLYQEGGDSDASFFGSMKESVHQPRPEIDFDTMKEMDTKQIIEGYGDDFSREFKDIKSNILGESKDTGILQKKNTFNLDSKSLENTTRSDYFGLATETLDGKTYAKEGMESAFGLKGTGTKGAFTEADRLIGETGKEGFKAGKEGLKFVLDSDAGKAITDTLASTELAEKSGQAVEKVGEILGKTKKASSFLSKAADNPFVQGASKVAGTAMEAYTVGKSAWEIGKAVSGEGDVGKAVAGAANITGSVMMRSGNPYVMAGGAVLKGGSTLYDMFA